MNLFVSILAERLLHGVQAQLLGELLVLLDLPVLLDLLALPDLQHLLVDGQIYL